jgi:hypothetical protein
MQHPRQLERRHNAYPRDIPVRNNPEKKKAARLSSDGFQELPIQSWLTPASDQKA